MNNEKMAEEMKSADSVNEQQVREIEAASAFIKTAVHQFQLAGIHPAAGMVAMFEMTMDLACSVAATLNIISPLEGEEPRNPIKVIREMLDSSVEDVEERMKFMTRFVQEEMQKRAGQENQKAA